MNTQLKKILWWLFLFAGLILLTDRFISTALSFVYTKTLTGQSGGKINYYLHQSAIPDLLIMGNSRAFYELDPDSFNISAFNIAHAGMDDCFQLGLLSILIQQHKAPSKILLHVEPVNFLQKDTAPFFSNDILQLKYYYGQNSDVTNLINDLGYFEKEKYWLHSYRFNGRVISELKNFYSTLHLPSDYFGNGFEKNPVLKTDSLKTITMAGVPFNGHVYFNKSKTRYLVALIQLALSNHIEVQCFTSPYFYKKNISYLQPEQQWIQTLMSKYQIRYIDYSTNHTIPELENASYWTDADHLNEKGAAIFSKQVVTDFQF